MYDQILKYLLHEELSLNPKTRYFLYKFLCYREIDEEQLLSVQDEAIKLLAEEMGITYHMASSAIVDLKRSGLLVRQAGNRGKQDRTVTVYRFAEKLVNALEMGFLVVDRKLIPLAISGAPYKDLVEGMMGAELSKRKAPATKKNSKGRPVFALEPKQRGTPPQEKETPFKKLNPSDRVLLSVLLFHADRCGVVRGLGKSDLNVWTGIKHASLRSQLRKLMDLGYLRSTASGLTGSRLFGKSNSLYFLNLRHPDYGPKLIPPGVISLYHWKPAHGRASEAYKIFLFAQNLQRYRSRKAADIEIDDVIKRKRGSLPVDGRFTLLVDYFQEQRLIPFLQVKLEQYASVLLTDCFQAISEANEIEHDELRAQIECEAFPQSKYQPEVDTEIKHVMVDFLFAVARQIATLVYDRILKHATDITFEEMTHVILPVKERHPRWFSITVESFACDGGHEGVKALYIENRRVVRDSEKKEMTLYQNVDGLSGDEVKYRCGLLTRPKK